MDTTVLPSFRTQGLPLSRRQFVKTSALAVGSVSLASVLPAAAFGANDRIRIGVIGCGGQGTGHVASLVKRSSEDNVSVVAVSDVYQRRVTRAKDICHGDGYLDYRKLLERKDIDAVLIATPDHWHGKISIEAMESGKHVYCEKPMTHTVEQALEVRDAVKRYKRKCFRLGRTRRPVTATGRRTRPLPRGGLAKRPGDGRNLRFVQTYQERDEAGW